MGRKGMICGVSETATNPQCGPRHKKADVTRKYFTKCSEGLSVTIKDDQGREYREKAAQTQLSEVVDELGMQSDLIEKDITQFVRCSDARGQSTDFLLAIHSASSD